MKIDPDESVLTIDTGPIEITSRESIKHAMKLMQGKMRIIENQLYDLEKVYNILSQLEYYYQALDDEGHKANVKNCQSS